MVRLVEEGVRGARITVHLPWSRWIFSMPEDPVRYPLTKGRAGRVSSASGACIWSALTFGRSTGFRTPACEKTLERVQFESVATSARTPKDDSWLQRSLRGSTRVAGHTLNVRQKGMRGRLLWFTPLRPARELKTAKIGKGHGGST